MKKVLQTIRAKLKKRYPEATKALGDWYRWTFHCRQEFGPELRYHKALKLADLGPDDKVLEIGHCNYQTLRVARQVQHVTVCNISGVNRAIQTLGPANLKQVQGNICIYPLQINNFDVALAIAVLEHVENDLAAVQNIYRALRPGGRFIIYVPDTDEHMAAWQRGEYRDHVRPGYTRSTMTDLLHRGGFEVEYCELENGIYAAFAGDLYYAVARWIPFYMKLPHAAVSPFMAVANLDNRKPGSMRWGLFCKAVKSPQG